MSKRKNNKLKKKFIKPIFLVVSLVAISLFAKIALPSYSADSTNPLRGSKFNILVQNPHNESIVTEFPDGNSVIEVNIDVYRRDGTPLVNEPIIVDHSSAINVQGPDSTEQGNIQFKFSSKKSLTDRVRIKLKNCPTVKADFKIRFASDNRITDLTDKNSFVEGAPLNLQAQIKPWMTDHIASAQARYIYTRRINKWGFWFSVRRVATEEMKCSDGICQVTFGSDFTKKDRNVSGNFTYQFVIRDEKGKTTSSKAVKAKLKSP